MSIPPSEARLLSYYDYQAILWNWNDAHAVSDDVAPPDPDVMLPLIDRINADPRMTGPMPSKAVN